MLPTINVNVFPVSESWSNRVSFDYLNEATLFTLLERLAITFPRVLKDWLIFLSSLKWSSLMSSPLLTFYDPAKSQRFSLAFFVFRYILENILLRQGVSTTKGFEIWYENDCFLYSWRSDVWIDSFILFSLAQGSLDSVWQHIRPIPQQKCRLFSISVS